MSATDADAVHAILPGGSVELRVADPADGGRRLFVRAPIKAGDEILSLNPYAAVLNDASRTSRCDHTFAKPSDNGGSLLRCARSKVARYVSRDAQVAAWKRGYKEECASLVNCAPRVPPATVRLAARRSGTTETVGDEHYPVEAADAACIDLLGICRGPKRRAHAR